ncbi:hypothetical protein [Chitinimonas sp.]|uniref:hypothetical protein n=1 Tax=Chitinimonas sp. TaxID=1934313 RepID=UPI002F935B0D
MSVLRLTLLAALLGTLAACGDGGGGGSTPTTPPPANGAPQIQSFSASPATLQVGQSAILSWQASGASSYSIAPGVGAVSGNSVAVAPVATTTYTLTASNGSGSVTATTIVTVTPVGTPTTQYGSMNVASLGTGASLNGAIPFPADNAWNRDVSAAPVDPNSANLIATIGVSRGLHPDFGAGLYDGAPIGIPYQVVSGSQGKVRINFTAYGDESDPGPYPVPAGAPIEGQRPDGATFDGDRHVLIVDKDNNRLYELYRAFPQADGSWNADSGAVFSLDSNTVRPGGKPGWTSADAAGLPIFPGLVRYDEAASGTIRHAFRFTVSQSRKAYVPPATHAAASSTDPNRPPMGMRVRLKASFVIPASFSTEGRAILQAMKTYGMIVADNGSNWYVSGAPDPRWNNDKLLSELGSAKGSDFEVIRMDGLVTP